MNVLMTFHGRAILLGMFLRKAYNNPYRKNRDNRYNRFFPLE